MTVRDEPGAVAVRAADDAIEQAEVGVKEQGGNNRGKWIAMYLLCVHLLVGNPWCMAFVVFRLQRAARWLKLPVPAWLPITGSTALFARSARKLGLFYTVEDAIKEPGRIRKGDLVFFYKKGLLRIGHVGIVVGLLKNSAGRIIGVRTVEGNTGPDGGRDGDGVYAKEREWAELGNPAKAGFVRLPF